MNTQESNQQQGNTNQQYSDSYQQYEETNHHGDKTRILSDDERRQFDGITIEEAGDSVHVEETPTFTNDQHQQQGYQTYGNPHVRVIHLGGSSWLSRIILIVILATIAAAIVFFGGIIVTIIGVVMLIGAIISFIFGLF